MIRCLPGALRRSVFFAAASGILSASLAAPSSAQMMKNKIIDSVANSMVSSIQSDSCADFAAMLKKRKSGGSSSSKAGGMMKNDPAARQRFVNKVSGPLVNKMIDCDMLPGH